MFHAMFNGEPEPRWQKVSQQKKTRDKKKGPRSSVWETAVWTNEHVRGLLSTFKTRQCHEDAPHDPRTCEFFHGPDDRRRNPYEEFYLPEECTNKLEMMYHPIIFKTSYCDRGSTCVFQALCARSHSSNDIRDRKTSAREYEQEPSTEAPPKPVLASFVPEGRQMRQYGRECEDIWKAMHLKPRVRFIELNPFQLFLVNRSRTLLQEIQEAAIEEGLGCVAKTRMRGYSREGLSIRAIHPDVIATKAMEFLQPPSPHFATKMIEYSERVIESIANLLRKPNGLSSIAPSQDVYIRTLESESKVEISAVQAGRDKTATDLIHDVVSKIKFWVSQENYDKYIECGCCFGTFNHDQGISCGNGHFYCDETCFPSAIKAQINSIRSNDGKLVCPNCDELYEHKDVAAHIPNEIWVEVQGALVAMQVEKETEKLQTRFDKLLQTKIEELTSKYKDADGLLKVQAQKHALEIRNSVLNLSCPHCGIPYAEFTGCMALQCQTCNKNFCGYCHSPFASGRGAHEHVRECIMNETASGSYYATPEQVEQAQRRYRVRKLKKYFQQFKKELRNAIVIELGRDLSDIGVRPDALFEVGNLHDAVYEGHDN